MDRLPFVEFKEEADRSLVYSMVNRSENGLPVVATKSAASVSLSTEHRRYPRVSEASSPHQCVAKFPNSLSLWEQLRMVRPAVPAITITVPASRA